MAWLLGIVTLLALALLVAWRRAVAERNLALTALASADAQLAAAHTLAADWQRQVEAARGGATPDAPTAPQRRYIGDAP